MAVHWKQIRIGQIIPAKANDCHNLTKKGCMISDLHDNFCVRNMGA